jgi:hypothetical protein
MLVGLTEQAGNVVPVFQTFCWKNFLHALQADCMCRDELEAMNVDCSALPACLDATSNVFRVIRGTKPPAIREKQPPAQQVQLEKAPAPPQPPPDLADAQAVGCRDGWGPRRPERPREDLGAWNVARTDERASRSTDDARSSSGRAPIVRPSEDPSRRASGRSDEGWLARNGNASGGGSPPEERGLHAGWKGGRISVASDGNWRRPGCTPTDVEGRPARGCRAGPALGSGWQSTPQEKCAACMNGMPVIVLPAQICM